MKRLQNRSAQSGFTLAEVLVATAVFAIIMIAALAVYDQSNQVFKKGSEASEVQQSTRIGFDKLVSDVRQAGFDYNRGGTPTTPGEYPQPDEQIEYAGKNVFVFRSNFNYNTATVDCVSTGKKVPCDNGREPFLEPTDSKTGNPAFPYVTTSNDEIIIYALRSADSSKNTQSISFWADVSQPRSAFPDSAKGGAEQEVVVSGIDTTGLNPPYTLYRITTTEALAGKPGTAIAENIRSLRFSYYTDLAGTTVLAKTNGDAITDTNNGPTANPPTEPAEGTGAIGGAGQYKVDSSGTLVATNNFSDRTSRATIVTVRVSVVGMNATPDNSYTNPNETIAALKHYRQYQLSALISPRNLGLTGAPEPSYNAPSPPTLTGICTGFCAAPVVCWQPPSGGGPVQTYKIEWDTNPINGSFSNSFIVTDSGATSATVPDSGIDPSQTWYYQVVASNDSGDSQPSNRIAVKPLNSTKPQPPSGLQASTANAPKSSPTDPANYTINLGWMSALNNDPKVASMTCVGSGCAADGTLVSPQEQIKFQIYRGTTANFNPTAGEGVAILSSTMNQGVVPPNTTGSFVDSADTSAFAPGACTQYYYRIQEMDRCASNAGWNLPAGTATATSNFSPDPTGGANAMPGKAFDAGAGTMASAVLTLNIDTAKSHCLPTDTNCHIVLTWPQVVTDTAGAHIGVDRYLLTRYRKRVDDLAYVLDTTIPVPGQSQINTGTAGYTDDTAPVFTDATHAEQWYYEYTVQADDCRISTACLAGKSGSACYAKADYPKTCGPTPTIIQAGASGGSGTANDPWVFNDGDTISVQPAAGSGLQFASVLFLLLDYPSGAPVGTPYTTTDPNNAVYTWTSSGLNAKEEYYIEIVVTYAGTPTCTETHVRYGREFAAAACQINPNNQIQSAVKYSFVTCTNSAVAKTQQCIQASYTITNQSTSDYLRIAGTGSTISALSVGNGGSGYTSVPTVQIGCDPNGKPTGCSNGGGFGAQATATVLNGKVTGFKIVNGGGGYTSAPTVTIGCVSSGVPANCTSGGGSGATATPTLASFNNLFVTYTSQTPELDLALDYIQLTSTGKQPLAGGSGTYPQLFSAALLPSGVGSAPSINGNTTSGFIAPGGSLTMTLEWNYASSEDNGKKAAPPGCPSGATCPSGNILQKLCIGYQLYSAGQNNSATFDVNDSAVKFCNIVSPSGGANNPASCD